MPFEIAWKLHTLGYSVIPSGGGESHKAPLVPWAIYQERQPTDQEMQDWEERLKPNLWGIVTGQRSGLVTLDGDHPEKKAELEVELGQPHRITPRGGAHFDFKHPRHPIKTVAGILPGIDIRGDGGFVNVVGKRPDGEYQILRLPTPDNLLPWGRLPDRIRAAMNGRRPPEGEAIPGVTTARGLMKHGERNQRLFKMASSMRRQGASENTIYDAVKSCYQNDCEHEPPISEDELHRIAASGARYTPSSGYINTYKYNASGQNETTAKGDKNGTTIGTTSLQKEARDLSLFEGLSKRVRAWIENTSGWWETRELDFDLGISGPRDKENRKKILQRLREQGVIEQHPKLNKEWRYVDIRVTNLLFKTASSTGVLPLRWPMGVEKYVNLFPGNVIVIAGSPNAGKTAFLLRFIYLNQDTFPIYYFCSEMGAVELRNRLEQFPGMAIGDWKFNAIERAADFADVIVADCINIVDYLEMTVDLYAVNTYLTAISHKTGSGLAIVALQKKMGAQFGRGQEFSLEKPKLYLSMDRGKLQIIKGKSWADKKVDPCGLAVCFKITGGCQFEITEAWDWKR